MDAQTLIATLADTIDQIDSVRRLPAPGLGDYGFIAQDERGLVLVAAEPGEPWFLTITAGIAADVGNTGEAIAWCNNLNAEERFGRFYLQTPGGAGLQQSIVFQQNVLSHVIAMIGDQFTAHAFELLKLAFGTIARRAPEAQILFPSDAFEQLDNASGRLVMASFG